LETLKHHYGTFKSFSTLLEGVDGAEAVTTLEWVPPLLNPKLLSQVASVLLQKHDVCKCWYLMLKL
jgi:hypothetical protein